MTRHNGDKFNYINVVSFSHLLLSPLNPTPESRSWECSEV